MFHYEACWGCPVVSALPLSVDTTKNVQKLHTDSTRHNSFSRIYLHNGCKADACRPRHARRHRRHVPILFSACPRFVLVVFTKCNLLVIVLFTWPVARYRSQGVSIRAAKVGRPAFAGCQRKASRQTGLRLLSGHSGSSALCSTKAVNGGLGAAGMGRCYKITE